MTMETPNTTTSTNDAPAKTKNNSNKIGRTNHVQNPLKYDVLLGRRSSCWKHFGNLVLRDAVDSYFENYEQSKLRVEKTMIIADIVNQIHEKGGRFLKREDGDWIVVEQKTAIEKVGHMIRDKRAMLRQQQKKRSSSYSSIATSSSTNSSSDTSSETATMETTTVDAMAWREKFEQSTNSICKLTHRHKLLLDEAKESLRTTSLVLTKLEETRQALATEIYNSIAIQNIHNAAA